MTPPATTLTSSDIDRRDRQKGYRGIGYHYVIRRDGVVETGRPEEQTSMHDPMGNARQCIAVCLIGGVDEQGNPVDNFTPEQNHALGLLAEELKARYGEMSLAIRTPSLN